MKKVIFVDRDGTIIIEPPIEENEQVDSLEKLEFVPGAISGMKALMNLGYEIVLASNQDGLGTESFPWETFRPAHDKMLRTLAGEGVSFDREVIDRTFPSDNAPTRKPGTALFENYLDGSYDLAGSFMIGDRETDAAFARNMGVEFLKIDSNDPARSWQSAVETIRLGSRTATVARKSSETDILIKLDLDGRGETEIDTGLKFLDHMLDQIVHHGGISLVARCKGDLEVDEHHTMEDLGIALGQALKQALSDKLGIGRYGFALPMDESRAIVLLDFGGRSELVWDVNFTREYVGDVPTEMFKHFFKSLSSSAACNIYINAEGENNHHIAEAVFKAFARSLRQAVRRDPFSCVLPSSKGMI